MNLATLLNVIDANEEIKIRNTNSLETFYEGQKYYVSNVDFNAEVIAVYTVARKINIEIT